MNFMNFEKIPEKTPNFEKGKKEAIEKIREMDLMPPHHRDLVLVMIGERPLTTFSFTTELEKKRLRIFSFHIHQGLQKHKLFFLLFC